MRRGTAQAEHPQRASGAQARAAAMPSWPGRFAGRGLLCRLLILEAAAPSAAQPGHGADGAVP